MRAEELRVRQGPLKERYRADAGAAMITLEASGALEPADVACSVGTGAAIARAGLHPSTGGDSTAACSGDMLLQALVACAGVTLRAVATNRDLDVAGNVRAEGDLDVRGTLGVDRTTPVGFGAIRLVFELESEAQDHVLQELVETTERHCVVLQSLRASPEVAWARADGFSSEATG